MNSTVVTAVLGLLQDLEPLIVNSGTIAKAITLLEEIVPVIAAEIGDLLQPVKNIIAALSAKGDVVTPDQLAALQALDAQVDAAFDAAAAAYAAAHPEA